MSNIQHIAFRVASHDSIPRLARDLFVSENFSGAIALLQDAFEPALSNELILQYLKGEVGLDENYEPIEETDEDYVLLVGEVMENYDFLFPLGGDKYLQGEHLYEFTAWNKNNHFEAYLLENEGKLIMLRDVDLGMKRLLNKVSEHSDLQYRLAGQLVNAEAFIYKDGLVMTLKKYDSPYYAEISKSYQDLAVLMDVLEAASV